MDEIPQPLWIPPSDWSKEVTTVLIRTGIHDHPKQFTATQKSTLRNASLRQSVKAKMFPIEKRTAFFLAYGKFPVLARIKKVIFRTKDSANNRLYTVNKP